LYRAASFASVGSNHSLDEDEEEETDSLSKEDWGFLLQGAKTVTYENNQRIVSEGETFQRIYQIVKGTCRIEKSSHNRPLGTMGAGQTFGEVSFLLSGGASASVIVDSDQVEVTVLEGYFINILFGMKPDIAGRFYKVRYKRSILY
jgi:CRP-like cAMP-binding protein